MKIKSKVFLDIILDHTKNPKRVKKILSTDKRLSQSEKMIVHGFLLMRDNKNGEALELAEEISKQSDEFVESMRQYLIAGLLNNLGHYKNALHHFKLSYEIFPKGELDHLEYVILNNLYIVYLNLHMMNQARVILKRMKDLKNLPDNDQLRLLNASFWFASITENNKIAKQDYLKLKSMEGAFLLHDFVSLQKSFFNYGLIFKQYDICYTALNELRTQKKHSLTQIYNFMKILLDHLTTDKPIYLVENEFKDHSQLLWELKAIRALDNNKKEEFQQAWDYLKQQNPDSYHSDGTFHGPKSLFSECFKKHQVKISKLPKIELIKDKDLPVLEALELKLQDENGITREELFYFLYGKEAETKDDLNRISKYINRLKVEKNLKILSKRGLYSIAA